MKLLTASSLALSLSLAACANTEVRTQIPQRDALGNTRPLVEDPIGAWQYHVDTQRMDGPLGPPFEALGGGLRVATTATPNVSGTADAHALVEGTPSALPVGWCRWPNPPHVSGFVAGSGWTGAEVEIAWVVSVRPRGRCAVEVEAVPRLTRGCDVVVLSDLLVRLVIGLDEAIVIGVDESSPAARQAEALVGSPPGRAGRFVIRVRG